MATKFIKGMHGVMREYVTEYGPSEMDSRFTVVPSARPGQTEGRNVAMGDINHPDVTIRDIAIDEHGGEVVVAEWNPSKPKERKVLKLESVEDIKNSTEEVKSVSSNKNVAAMLELDESDVKAQPAKSSLTVIAPPPSSRKAQTPSPTSVSSNGTPAPQQLVKFYMSEAVMGIKYHEVIIKGISLVLAFDKSYEAATVPEFAVTEDNKAFRIEVAGYPYVLNCYYYGQHFEHNGFVYTLFAIYDTEELK